MTPTYPEAIIVVALIAGFLGYQILRRRDSRHRLDLLHAERLAAMDKGIPLPEVPLDPPASAWKRPPDPRTPLAIGMVLVAFGLGTAITLALVAEGRAYWSLPLPIVFMGVGLILFYRLTKPASLDSAEHGA